MSLINDALKKAQKQRTGETDSTPAVGGGDPGPRVVRRGKPAGPSPLVLGGIGLGAVAIIAVAVVFIMRRPAAEPAPAKPAPVVQAPLTQPAATQPAMVQAPVQKPVEVAPQPVVQAPPVVAPPVHQPVQVVTVASPKPEPVQPKAEPVVTTTVVTPPVITVPTTEAARPAAPGKLEPRAITFIESIRVAGIRASGSDRKVLMNDRVYRLGDLVEPEMGLTLVGIAFNALTFQDEKGAKYTRNF